jgi:uncharacterized short protein YbdD (DUF466 family)
MWKRIKRLWASVRQLSGDDAYERYLDHFEEHHASGGEVPLTKKAFFKAWQDKKWTGIKRCC